ncbi:MAG: glycosyltransferase family 4 protein [Saprospiraceae bacterium]|nr:glycosyltransferase family 4 protein [Saprospiraceae bacterium]
MKILFLYTRLADYFYQGLRYLAAEKDAELLVITQRPDPNAPFQFEEQKRLQIKDGSGLSLKALEQLALSFQPDILYVAGWADPRYRKLARDYRQKGVPVVLGMDNPWKGTLRQSFGALIGKYRIQKMASHIWVPGSPQYAFASRLGFSQTQILTGLYCANIQAFAEAGKKRKSYPRKLLFVGRFVDYKQPLQLARTFQQLQQEKPSDWSLHFIGRGPLETELKKIGGPNLYIHDFVPPQRLPATLAEYGVFCLPSQNEHWGVVVHEAAAAGMPLLLSDTVGAADAFLIPGFNGFTFQTGNESDLQEKLKHLMESTDSELQSMGANSKNLAMQWDYPRWAATLLSVKPTLKP